MAKGIEEVVEQLKQVEDRLDKLYEEATVYRRELVELASREAEKLKNRLLEEARATQERLLSEEVRRSEEKAREIIAKGAAEASRMRKRAEELRKTSEEMVIKSILSGKITL
ncbi:MAG: hypothetical protein NZ570_03845 [Candidatus Caldarchaeum sp.]|nr:hypothetical protein [Candidatus Caldarchaeum sp.]MCS7137781.1 hypothetical protein [Candidatus Caldarchaeum sp.]MDW7978357.1 hypothetical protein [Candidatus Caldarchaeum sp.]MDW8359830.1 hypothetical protein [Candidatus Caldarchaeum sp.]